MIPVKGNMSHTKWEQKKGETNGKETRIPASAFGKENTINSYLICSNHFAGGHDLSCPCFTLIGRKASSFAVFADSTQGAVETEIAM